MSNLTFPKSLTDRFRHNNKALRYGQAFHRFMRLEKLKFPADKAFCDKLYNADDETAKAMIASRINKNA